MRRDRPNADELLEAVEEHLREKLLPVLEGHLRFHTLVAANVVAIVRRELAQSPQLEAEEKQRLLDLLGHDGDLGDLNAELAEKIRNGDFALDDPRLLEHLRELAIAKVGVDSPKYAAYRRAKGEKV